MTYCLAMRLDAGLVFASDSRTNAGVDYVTTVSKMHVFRPGPERVFVVLSAGNLGTTQEVVFRVRRDLAEDSTGGTSLATVRYMFEAAEYLGQVSQAVQRSHAAAMAASGISGETSLILGGQIAGQPQEILLVYPQGNFIAATDRTPYLQIGETKYGKPVLDRMVSPDRRLDVAARLALLSLEGTARSNVSVGPPFEIGVLPTDHFGEPHHFVVEEGSDHLTEVRDAMNRALDAVLSDLRALPADGS